MTTRASVVLVLLLIVAPSAYAQHGYEFEVYGTDIGPRGSTELELSSNYVADGLRDTNEGVYPTHHASRISFELSRTFSNWLQGTVYTSANSAPARGLSYVGNRLRVTTIAPSAWHLPLEVGLANELIYSGPGFGEYRWAYELTPIFVKDIGRVELVFNPAFERGLSGSGEHHIEMEPRGKIEYGLGDDGAVALEYYAGLGGVGEGYALAQQRHQVFAKIETEMSPRIEAAFGVGRGLTRSSDRWVLTAAFEYKLR